MLNIEFRSDVDSIHDEILFEAPYTKLTSFIADEPQGTSAAADKYVEQLRRIMAGTDAPWVDETGNAWTMDIDAKVARLTCYLATPVATIELPTAWLVDVLERWRDHLIAKKKRKQQGA